MRMQALDMSNPSLCKPAQARGCNGCKVVLRSPRGKSVRHKEAESVSANFHDEVNIDQCWSNDSVMILFCQCRCTKLCRCIVSQILLIQVQFYMSQLAGETCSLFVKDVSHVRVRDFPLLKPQLNCWLHHLI